MEKAACPFGVVSGKRIQLRRVEAVNPLLVNVVEEHRWLHDQNSKASAAAWSRWMETLV